MGNNLKPVAKGNKYTNKEIPKNQPILPQHSHHHHPNQQSPDLVPDPNHHQLKIYTILMNKNQLNTYKDSLAFRNKYPDQLIQISYGESLKDQKQYFKMQVYLEKIQFTLQQLSYISFNDMMSIFYRVFKGFKELYKKFGCFQVDPRMIGFNSKAETKVWCNIKYSRPTPKQSYKLLNEQQMITEIIEIFMNKIDLASIPFNKNVSRRFKLEAKTYEEAIQAIENQIEQGEDIPKQIQALKMLIESDEIKENQKINVKSRVQKKNLQKKITFNYGNPISQINKQKNKVNFTFGKPDFVIDKNRTLSCPKKLVTFSHNQPQSSTKSRISILSTDKTNQLSRITKINELSRITINGNPVNNKSQIKKSSSALIFTPRANQNEIKFTYHQTN